MWQTTILGVEKKYGTCKQQSANDLQKTANYFWDEVYDGMCDLKANADVFSADLYYHKACFPNRIVTFFCIQCEKI